MHKLPGKHLTLFTQNLPAMKRTIARRAAPEVNAGSMADIAFLLLIFFLVTTTIMSDSGILVKLPPWDTTHASVSIKERNLMQISINANNQYMLRDEEIALEAIRERVKTFIMNPQADAKLAEASNKAVLSLINDRATSFEAYLQVYNELKGAYQELWEEAAQRRYQQHYESLPMEHQLAIRRVIPLVISEAEPTEY